MDRLKQSASAGAALAIGMVISVAALLAILLPGAVLFHFFGEWGAFFYAVPWLMLGVGYVISTAGEESDE